MRSPVPSEHGDPSLPWGSAPDWDAKGSHTHQQQSLGEAASDSIPKGSCLGCSGLFFGPLVENHSPPEHNKRDGLAGGGGGSPTQLLSPLLFHHVFNIYI